MGLLLDGWQRAKAGMGQAFSVIGEAGVGKSRFLYEFRKAVSNEEVTFLEGKCLSYGKAAAWHPIIDILKANFEITEDDGDAQIREKVLRGLKALKADDSRNASLSPGASLGEGIGNRSDPYEPGRPQRPIIEALIRIVIKGPKSALIWPSRTCTGWTSPRRMPSKGSLK